MSVDDAIGTIVLQEFRLRTADTTAEVARIVAAFPNATGPGVPLLTSIADDRDVAVVRAVHAGEMAGLESARRCELDRLVMSWQPPQRYTPRISGRTTRPPASYRLAVTESGINGADPDPLTVPAGHDAAGGTSMALDLLWVGVPIGSYAGLLVLIGNDGDSDRTRPDPREWPLPLSSFLGVRIYSGG